MTDKNFVEGLSLKEFKFDNGGKITKVGVNVDKHTAWLQDNKNDSGFVNFDIKMSQKGVLYAELNTYVKPAQEQPAEQQGGITDDDLENLPF